MSLPALKFEIAFTTGPFDDSPDWEDVTAYWVGGRFALASRSFELDQMEPGGGEAIFDNADRRFEPEFVSSPYYPNVLPLRRARITAAVGIITDIPVWAGYVETWPPDWEQSEITVRMLDGQEALARFYLDGSFADEPSGTRIANVLDAVGFPAGDRNIDTGQSDVAAATFAKADRRSAAQHIRDIVTTDGPTASFFFDAQGRAVFRDRHTGITYSRTSTPVVFNDDGTPGDTAYEAIEPDFSKDLIFNDVTVTRDGGTPQSADDATSQGVYGPRSRSISTLHTNDSEPADYAAFVADRYANPSLRFNAIDVEPVVDDNTWLLLLAIEHGQRATVKRHPPEHPTITDAVEKECIVEGKQFTFPRGELASASVRLSLSPLDLNTYWLLEDAEAGVLGMTTRLAL